jgi:hypothetical protein
MIVKKLLSGKMPNPTRVTVAFDKPTAELLEKISTENGVSQSETMRRALKFYSQNKALEDPANKKKTNAYLDMLLSGETHNRRRRSLANVSAPHPILPRKGAVLERTPRTRTGTLGATKNQSTLHRGHAGPLEACNFYRLIKNGPNDFTLVLVSEVSKDFIRVFLEEYFAAMGAKVEVKENLTKLRVIIKPSGASRT